MKKQKVAIICAHPAGTNNGMISVDLAINVLETRFSDVEFIKYTSWKSKSKGSHLTYLHYYSPNQLDKFDYIIFWGDFLHWIGYANNDWLNKTKRMDTGLSDNEIIDLWYSLYLLENREDLQKKTILFGGTIYGLNATQLTNNRYKDSLTKLVKNSKLVKTRDILSANFVSQLDPKKYNVFGCDCSLLFDGFYFSQNKDTEPKSYFLYSFSRSGKKVELENFVKLIEKNTNLSAVHIPWIEKGAGPSTLEKNIKLIQNSKFVFTDIYHLCLNSWREDVIAICVGNGNSIVTDTLSDKKKEIFYQQIFASNYYLFVEDIISDSNTSVKKVIERISDKKSKDLIVKHLTQHVSKTLNDLIVSLDFK